MARLAVMVPPSTLAQYRNDEDGWNTVLLLSKDFMTLIMEFCRDERYNTAIWQFNDKLRSQPKKWPLPYNYRINSIALTKEQTQAAMREAQQDTEYKSLSQSLLTAHNSTQYTNAQQTDYSTPSMIHITLGLTRVVSTLTPQEVKNEIEEEQRRMYASRCSVFWSVVEVQT